MRSTRPPLLRSASAACLLLATAAAVHAATWVSLGPDGGAVSSLAAAADDPATLYAGTFDGGVYKTTDGGASWRPMSRGISGPRVLTVQVDPRNRRVAWAASFGGVWKTTDGGRNWLQQPLGQGVVSLALAPQAPDTAYVAWVDQVGRTRDGGATWSFGAAGLEHELLRTVTVDSQDPATVWAGSWNGILRSLDGGASWSRFGAGLPEDTPFESIVFAPTDAQTVYAASGFAGVFVSRDHGASWAPAGAGLPTLPATARQAALLADPSAPGTVFAGIALGVDAVAGGIWKSTDFGANWARVRSGSAVWALAAADDGALYAGTGDLGVEKSQDSGASWHTANRGLRALRIAALEVDPHQQGRLFLGAHTNGGTPASLGVWASGDRGATWRPMNTGLRAASGPLALVQSLAADPATPGRFLAGTLSGVFVTANAGRRWSPSFLGYDVADVAIDPRNSKSAFAVGSALELCGIPFCGHVPIPKAIKTEDGGASWQLVNRGIERPGAPPLTGRNRAVVIHPNRSATAFVAGPLGLYRTRNGGARWVLLASGFPTNLSALALDERSPNVIYAGAFGVWKSTDAGTTWRRASSGLPDRTTVFELLLHPTRRNTLYAATGAGVFVSRDGAASWARLGDGFPAETAAFSLAVDDSGRLYAGTAGAGLWVLE